MYATYPMRSFRRLSPSLAALMVLALLAGCRSAPSAQPSGADSGPPELSASVRWVAGSAEYQAIFRQTYRLAEERLLTLVEGREAGTWAVALDGDETVISNLGYEERLEERGVSHTAKLWEEWVNERAAPPLPGAVAFLERVHELGGRVAIVTNRDEALCPATEDNLRSEGIPVDVVLCRPPGEREKEPRWHSVEIGTAAPDLPAAEIVMWVGDNINDFPWLDQSLREEGAEAYEDFGGKFFIVPNPMYGSWQ